MKTVKKGHISLEKSKEKHSRNYILHDDNEVYF